MDYVTFGRTGLVVSAVGLGSGGASKLGLGTGGDERGAVSVIRRALDLGVTYVDTAKGYGTEDVVGAGLRGVRDAVVLSSKAYVTTESGAFVTPAEMAGAIDDSLRRLDTDVIDVYHLHRLARDEYDYAMTEIVPVLERARDAGKIRYFGVSESTSKDGSHVAAAHVAAEGFFDVLMVGFNFFNQGACDDVFPAAIAHDVAVEIMGSARGPYSRPERLRDAVAALVAAGELDANVDPGDPLGFLLHDGGASSLAEAAYRLTRYEPGVHVVLVGTGSVAHLEENVASLHAGPLPEADRERLRTVFGHLRVARG